MPECTESALAMEPLNWPPSGKPDPTASNPPLVFYIIVMLFGGIVTLTTGSALWLFVAAGVCGVIYEFAIRIPRRSVVLHVRRQLANRPSCLHTWGDDPERRELALLLCDTIARVMKWPNGHFIPRFCRTRFLSNQQC